MNSRGAMPPLAAEFKENVAKPATRVSLATASNNNPLNMAGNLNNSGRRSSLVPPSRYECFAMWLFLLLPILIKIIFRKSSLVPQRTSSISNQGRANDPRNINDKQFFSNSIRTLVEYLTTHNYDHPINPKTLMKPTNKDYYNIVLFLFHQIDPNYTCVGKLEDEIVGMFKFLGYPFPIVKSNMYWCPDMEYT